ncbi:hypothetical protein ACERIT_01085 [Halopenitus sp. H-Gu1]|uniref:hypothetical protein n=1 Tax=Halopenitus sp. H-Gu1 TaxID=3242697 RepID=UPI00359DD63A
MSSTPADQTAHGLVLSPADSPNSQYTVVTDSGELALSIGEMTPGVGVARLNSEAVTTIDRVLTLHNAGDRPVTVWLDAPAEDVRFYRGDAPAEPMEGREDAVTLTANETLSVGVAIDTRGNHDVESADSFTVHAERPDRSPPGDDPDESHDPPVEISTPELTPSSTPTSTPTLTSTSSSTDVPIGALDSSGDNSSASSSGSDDGSDTADISESSVLDLTSWFDGFSPTPQSVSITVVVALLGLSVLFRFR